MYLNTHTYFSLRYGTIAPRDVLEYFQKLGVSRFALTDINNTSACLEVLRLAPKYNCTPVLG
ncbi:MAG: DNA polymerase III alpha subunit, partial [Planctomycetota bacterium]